MMFEEHISDKNRYIITFKKKEMRKDKETDKTAILQRSVGPRLEFIDVGKQAVGFTPPDDPEGLMALDINDYELPMVFTALTEAEAGVLSKDSNIAAVEPDGIVYAQGLLSAEMPLESSIGKDLGVVTPAASSEGPSAQADTIPWGVSAIGAPMCWDATKGKGIYVAVIDTGIWPHNDLKGNLLGGISFVPGESWVDGHGHGTHGAGTIAARINGFGVVGVAPSAYLYGIKVIGNGGSGLWSWLMSGLYWMRKYHGCTFDVAAMLLGGLSAPSAVEAHINYAAQQTLLVAPAGSSGGGVGYPAKYDKCIAVSAIQSNNVITSFSSRGTEVELCAPGVNILSTVPGNSYAYFSGTSMAASHVAGAAALCRGTHRYLDMDHIRKILRDTADDPLHRGDPPGKDDMYGYGRVDCNQATFARTCG